MSISRAMARVRAATQHGARDRGHETIENREDCVRKDLTRRIKCVCADLTTLDFEALITAMTREQLRGEGIGAEGEEDWTTQEPVGLSRSIEHVAHFPRELLRGEWFLEKRRLAL
jgi:hypothetical protein